MVKRKYRYVEDFKDPVTGKSYEGLDSPKIVKTRNFGTLELHQIAKVGYIISVDKRPKVRALADGTTVLDGVEVIETRIEKMGEKGGYVEHQDNLAQNGECWIHEGGIVCGDAYVSGDAQIYDKGEVGGSAKVKDKAKIYEYSAIMGNSTVYGEGLTRGDAPKEEAVVSGNAEVCGEVLHKSTVSGNAFVGPDGTVDNSSASDFSMIFGTISDKTTASERSIVYGKVVSSDLMGSTYIYRGDKAFVRDSAIANAIIKGTVVRSFVGISEVSEHTEEIENDDGTIEKVVKKDYARDGQPVVEEEGIVKGESYVYGNARVSGTVSGGSRVYGNCLVFGDGCTVSGKSECSGNAYIDGGTVEGMSIVTGNVHTLGGIQNKTEASGNICQEVHSTVNKTVMDGNTAILAFSTMTESSFSGGALCGGPIEKSRIYDCPSVHANGRAGRSGDDRVSNSLVEGAAMIVGWRVANSLVGTSSIVGYGGEVEASNLSGNAKVNAEYKGTGTDNGLVLVPSVCRVSGNGVIAGEDGPADGNEVFIEEGGGILVICKDDAHEEGGSLAE